MRNLWGHHEYTYLHCVNVAILAVSVGIKMNLTAEDLTYLGTAGILHDIGKNKIPAWLLDKTGQLSEEEYGMLRKHPEYGYDMLTSSQELTSVTRAGVLQHHERYDGSGYPRGLKGKEITLYARILAVADTYDAMTSDRAYREAYAPSEAVEYLMGNGDQLYDNLVIDAFVKCVTIYPLGSCVELNNGVRAVVVKNYADCVLRPLIRVIESKEMIDLKNDTRFLNLCITKIVI
jgi:putative nucleotidyltransferase with HDIG domain